MGCWRFTSGPVSLSAKIERKGYCNGKHRGCKPTRKTEGFRQFPVTPGGTFCNLRNGCAVFENSDDNNVLFLIEIVGI